MKGHTQTADKEKYRNPNPLLASFSLDYKTQIPLFHLAKAFNQWFELCVVTSLDYTFMKCGV